MSGIFAAILLLEVLLVSGCENSPDGNAITSVSGMISYSGIYGGQNTTIYVRGYRDDLRAVGEPDFVVSIAGAGHYEMDLDGYEGDLYVSAFMDVDETGNLNGPSANDTLIDGVYSDPLGCYGDYAFESGGPIKLVIDGEQQDIDFELFDSGVIKASLSDTGHCTFGVIKNHLMNDEFLHHTHGNIANAGETILLAVPPKYSWFCKVKFDDAPPQLYPDSVGVSANSLVEINF